VREESRHVAKRDVASRHVQLYKPHANFIPLYYGHYLDIIEKFLKFLILKAFL